MWVKLLFELYIKGKESEEMMQSMEKLQIDESSSSSDFKRKPVVIIVVGMAGQ